MLFKDFLKYMHIGGNSTTVVGITPSHVGFRKSKPLKTDKILNKAICNLIFNFKMNPFNLKIKNALSKVLNKDRIVYTGSYDSNIEHLKSFFRENKGRKATGYMSAEKLIEICSYAKDWFKTRKVSYQNPSELYHCTNFNPDADAGYFTSIFLRSRQKGYTNFISRRLSQKYYNLTREIPFKNNTLWNIFAREKDIKTTSEETKVSTRVVLSTEEYASHFYGWVFQKIMKNIGNDKMHISGEFDGLKAFNLYKKIRNFDFFLEADWSKFDSTIDKEYLLAAMSILFNNSFESKEDKRMLFNVMTSVVYKNVIIPPGIVVELNRGNPSGHPGVTAVNCFVNLIRWAVIGYNIYGKNYSDFMDIEVYGDDAIVALKQHPDIYKIDEICSKYGYESEPLVPNIVPTFVIDIQDFEKPDFLKRYFSLKGVEWNVEKVLTKMFYQSKNRTNEEQLELIYNYIVTGPSNDDFNNFILKVANEMVKIDPSLNNLNDSLQEALKFLNKSRFEPTVSSEEGLKFNKKIDSTSIKIYLPRFKNFNREILKDEEFLALFIASNYSNFINSLTSIKYVKWFVNTVEVKVYNNIDKNKFEQDLHYDTEFLMLSAGEYFGRYFN